MSLALVAHKEGLSSAEIYCCEGSIAMLWKQLDGSSSHANSGTFVLSELVGQFMMGQAFTRQLSNADLDDL